MSGELADALIGSIDKLIADRLDAAITSRLAASAYVVPDNAGVAAIKTKTDLIPASGPSSAADFNAARAALLDNLDALISSRATVADVWAAASRTLTALPSVIRSVQIGQGSLASGIFSLTPTVVAVDTSKAVLIHLGTETPSSNVAAGSVRMWIDSPTTIRIDRDGTASVGVYIYTNFCLVEFV